MSPEANALLRSDLNRLGTFLPPEGHALEDEEPLFAATKEFAAEFGGPITQAFLQKLPQEWNQELLVIDSALMWLPVGAWPGPLLFHRERYTESNEGAFGITNADLSLEHIVVVLSPIGFEILVGDVPTSMSERSMEVIWAGAESDAARRDANLCAMLDQGQLSLETVAPGEMIRYSAATFYRFRPSAKAGFHLSLRATRGSHQPLVNGFRTIV